MEFIDWNTGDIACRPPKSRHDAVDGTITTSRHVTSRLDHESELSSGFVR